MIIPYLLYKQHQQGQSHNMTKEQLAEIQSQLTPKQQRILARSLKRSQQGKSQEHLRDPAVKNALER